MLVVRNGVLCTSLSLLKKVIAEKVDTVITGASYAWIQSPHPGLSSWALTQNKLSHIIKGGVCDFLTSKMVLKHCLKGPSRKVMGFNG